TSAESTTGRPCGRSSCGGARWRRRCGRPTLCQTSVTPAPGLAASVCCSSSSANLGSRTSSLPSYFIGREVGGRSTNRSPKRPQPAHGAVRGEDRMNDRTPRIAILVVLALGLGVACSGSPAPRADSPAGGATGGAQSQPEPASAPSEPVA